MNFGMKSGLSSKRKSALLVYNASRFLVTMFNRFNNYGT